MVKKVKLDNDDGDAIESEFSSAPATPKTLPSHAILEGSGEAKGTPEIGLDIQDSDEKGDPNNTEIGIKPLEDPPVVYKLIPLTLDESLDKLERRRALILHRVRQSDEDLRAVTDLGDDPKKIRLFHGKKLLKSKKDLTPYVIRLEGSPEGGQLEDPRYGKDFS